MRRLLLYDRLPDPWVPLGYLDWEAQFQTNTPPTIYAGAAWPTANFSIAWPFYVPVDCTVYSMSVAFTTGGTDNFDIGIYAYDYTLLASKGSTATAAGVVTYTLSDLRLQAGLQYYIAVVMNGTTNLIFRSSVAGAQVANDCGAFGQATAFPLPNPATPAPIANTPIPLVVLGIR